MPPKLHVIGCGEAFDSEYGNTSFLLEKPKILFDCGYQIPERVWKIPKINRELEAIALTHVHADHAFGVIPLLMRMGEEKRKRRLTIVGPPGIEKFLKRLFEMVYAGAYSRFVTFPVQYVEVKPGDQIKLKGLKFSFEKTLHSTLNLSIRVQGKITGKPVDFAISGDGAWSKKSAAFYNGVNLLLQETYSVKPKYELHSNLEDLTRNLKNTKIDRVGLTHFCRTERTQIIAVAKKLGAKVFVVKAGSKILL